MREAKTYRNGRIWQQFLAGDTTLKAIASKHGISLERVRQIIHDEARLHGVKGLWQARRTRDIRELVANPGCTLPEWQ